VSGEIRSASDVYDLLDVIRERARARGNASLDEAIHNAVRGGSTGLEVLGRVQVVLKANLPAVEALVSRDERAKLDRAFEFILKAYTD
jgi:hypothetical protein